MNTFYMVHVAGESLRETKYEDCADAMIEAGKVAREFPGEEVFVLVALSRSVAGVPPVEVDWLYPAAVAVEPAPEPPPYRPVAPPAFEVNF